MYFKGAASRVAFHFSLNISITVGWIAMKSGAVIHGAQKMNNTDFGDPGCSYRATIRFKSVVLIELNVHEKSIKEHF